MEPYQQRVVEEKAELDVKLKRLRAFTSSPGGTFHSLPAEEKERLAEQAMYMANYSEVLRQRIAAFSA